MAVGLFREPATVPGPPPQPPVEHVYTAPSPLSVQ